MKPEYEKQLEAEIDRELKGLRELPAPPTLAARVRLAIERRANVAWYRRPWQTWPVALRAASFALLLALFGGLCFLGGRLVQGEAFLGATHKLGPWLSSVNALGNAASVLSGAVVLAVKQLNAGFLLAILATVAVGYAMCVGLGTVCVRLAFARR